MKAKTYQIKTGDVFGRLTVINEAECRMRPRTNKRIRRWNCLCECGNKAVVLDTCLKKGTTKSCRCLSKEITSALFRKHGCSRNAIKREIGPKTGIYATWCQMRQRCENINSKYYKDYGGRGISVCGRWADSFTNFLEDMGERPKGMTLGRIDNNGNYCKENCRWETWGQQQNNRRSNRIISYNGRSMTLAEWSRETGLGSTTITHRLDHLNWTVDQAMKLGTDNRPLKFRI